MLLRERILSLALERGRDTFARRRLDAALRTIESELGALDLAVLGAEELHLAQQVTIGDDGDAVWIVFGQWADGTYDLIREQGMFSRDVLTGWRPGQTLSEFHKELADEPLPEVPQDGKGNVRPFPGDAPHPGRPRG